MAKKDRERKRERDPSDGPKSSRRSFLQRVGETAVEAGGIAYALRTPDRIGGAALGVIVGRTADIPDDLQQQIHIGDGEYLDQLGDSEGRGAGSGGISPAQTTAAQLRRRGIDVTARNGAIDNSLISNIVEQNRRVRAPGTRGVASILTGHNTLQERPEVLDAMRSLDANPWQPGIVRSYGQMRDDTIGQLEEELEGNVERVLNDRGDPRAFLYQLFPLWRARRIVHIDPDTQKPDYAIDVARSPIAQGALADWIYEGNKAIVRVGKKLRKKGGIIRVEPTTPDVLASDFGPQSYQHPRLPAYERIGGRSARGYDGKK